MTDCRAPRPRLGLLRVGSGFFTRYSGEHACGLGFWGQATLQEVQKFVPESHVGSSPRRVLSALNHRSTGWARVAVAGHYHAWEHLVNRSSLWLSALMSGRRRLERILN